MDIGVIREHIYIDVEVTIDKHIMGNRMTHIFQLEEDHHGSVVELKLFPTVLTSYSQNNNHRVIFVVY